MQEAVRQMLECLFKAKKIIKALPPTAVAKMHCKHLEEFEVVVENYTAQLENITINGTMPDDSKPVSVAILKDLLKHTWASSKDL